MAMSSSGLGATLGGIFGLFNNPYSGSSSQAKKYANQAASYQQPFYNSGVNSIQPYEDWMSGMQDPAEFINNLMGQYSESPQARYEEDQGMRAATNAGSANGLTGSTPLMQQEQENAENISSEDINSWLKNVLGINTEYGSALNNNINRGQKSANSLSNIYSGLGNEMSGLSYGSSMNKNISSAFLMSGLLKMLMG